VASTIPDAAGIRVRDLPITPPKLRRFLRQCGKAERSSDRRGHGRRDQREIYQDAGQARLAPDSGIVPIPKIGGV